MRILMTILLALVPAVGAQADKSASGTELRTQLDSINELLAQRQADPLPALTEYDHAMLGTGQGVLKEQVTEGSALVRATYFRVVELAPWRLWLALSDSEHHEEFMPYIGESSVLEMKGDSKLAYQYMDMPRGIRDRHWIIRSWDNGALWNQSGRRIWETHWKLETDSEDLVAAYLEEGFMPELTLEQIDDAIYTPVNEGYWLLVDLQDDRCLVAYQAVSDFGGKVPTWLVNELGPSSLKKLVNVVEERGRRIEETFSPTRKAPPAPDGSAIDQLQ